MGTGNCEFCGSNGREHVERRSCVFQTETASVLGMDSHQFNSSHIMKRKPEVVLALNTALKFGAKDQATPVEILGNSICCSEANVLAEDFVEAIKTGIDPIPIDNGLGGAYCVRNSRGENVAVVKPSDEEPFAPNNPKGLVGRQLGQPGLSHSVRVGETIFRELAAYLLDYDHFANVPPTFLAKVGHVVFNINNGVHRREKKKKKKLASVQKYVPHDFDANDHGTSSFLVASVHRIGILDVRIFNTDRHAGNILVRKVGGIGMFEQAELIPIDHGLCLPESLGDPYLEWIHWPQASIPFSEDELEYIRNLDASRDCQMLRAELPMIREVSLRILVLCTVFLQEAADFGLCLAEIGEMMTRESHSHHEPSELEALCIDARKAVAERGAAFFETEEYDEEVQFHLEHDGSKADLVPKQSNGFFNERSFHDWYEVFDYFYSPSKLDKTFEDNEMEGIEEAEQERLHLPPKCNWFEITSKSATPSKKVGLVKRNKHLQGGKAKGPTPLCSSADDQLPACISFMKIEDMNDEEWDLFIETFKEFLHPAFAKRRSATLQKQRFRLGASCKF